MQKISPENFLPLLRNRQKTELISLVMTSMTVFTLKSKSIQLHTDLANKPKLDGI